MVALVSFCFFYFLLSFRFFAITITSIAPFFFFFFFSNPLLALYFAQHRIMGALYLFDLCSFSYVQEDCIFMCLLFEKLTSVSCDNCLLCCYPRPLLSDLMYRSYPVFCLLIASFLFCRGGYTLHLFDLLVLFCVSH